MADDYKIRDKSLEKLDSSVQEAENTIESSSEDSWKCTHQSRCDDSEIFQETGCSKEQEATVENTTLYSISEPRASRTPYSVNSVKAETEHPRQQGGNENPTSVQPKEVVSITVENGNHDSLEKTSPSRSEETYDEITKSEVTSLDDWEDVQQSCLFETPPVDPEALRELELRANDIAGNLDRLLTSLGNSLKAMSHVSTECLSAYSACVDHMSETVDVNIKAMYTLIARCEELNASLKPVQNMAEQIKDIKKTLEIFEALCK